jgi:beta-glucosidase
VGSRDTNQNGCATPDGRVDNLDRIDYFRAHLARVLDAIAAGLPIAAYFAWSLMDNFEWAHGYAKRFGIVEVDFDTLERRPKRSALWYADVAATGMLPDPRAT